MSEEIKTEVEDKIEENQKNESLEIAEGQAPVTSVSAIDEEKKKLEIENAELRGKASAFEAITKNVPRGTEQNDQEKWKLTALQDSNVLDEHEFQEKYKYTKLQVAQAIHEYEIKNLTSSQNEKFAKLEAENKLASKYSDLFEYKSQIQEAINDVSPEVRQDPERLSKVIERAYLANVKQSPRKENHVERKNIVTGFEKPSPKRELNKKEENDEIPEEYAKICHAFGIKSEKERRSYIESDDIETHFGNGLVFRDRKKGIETIA